MDEQALVAQFVPVTIGNLQREYPNGILHHSGLNLSRAWMLEGIASGLPVDDPRRVVLGDLAYQHRTLGLPDAVHPDYMVSHWAPTFALYLVTGRWTHSPPSSRKGSACN